jgi:hypothetical protein
VDKIKSHPPTARGRTILLVPEEVPSPGSTSSLMDGVVEATSIKAEKKKVEKGIYEKT